MWCAVPSSGLIMDRPGQAMHTRAACSHCMQERKSGFRFQNAEGQRHAAVVAEESFALRWCSSIHRALPPEKRYSGAPLSSRTASISQSAKGPARPVPAALRKASFAAKSAAALAALWALRGRSFLRKPQRLPLRRAEDPGRKGGAMGAAEAFCHPGSVAEVAADAVYHDMPLFCKNSFADLHDKIGKI